MKLVVFTVLFLVAVVFFPNHSPRGIPRGDNATSEILVLPDGRMLSYSIYGPRRGSATVFYLHSVQGSRFEIGSLQSLRETNVRCIVFDRAGNGRSTPTFLKQSYEEVVGDLLHLADHLQVRQFGLVGYSIGANLALAAVQYIPRERLTGVSIFGGGLPLSERKDLGFGSKALVGIATYFPWLIIRALHLEDLRRNFAAHRWTPGRTALTPEAERGEVVAETYQSMLNASLSENAAGGFWGVVHDVSRWGDAIDFDNVDGSGIPLTVFAAQNDGLVPAIEMKRLGQLLTSARVAVVKEAGHFRHFIDGGLWRDMINAAVGISRSGSASATSAETQDADDEAERQLAEEKLEAAREAGRIEMMKRDAERLEAERQEKQKLELERLEREKEANRLLKEEAERQEKERQEKEEGERQEKARKEKEEAARLAKEKSEKEEAERQEKAKQEKEDAERLAKEKLEAERLEKEKIEKEKIEKEREEVERAKKEKEEEEEAARKEQERLEAEKKEAAEKLEKEKAEAERLDREQREKEEAERLEKERKEKEEEIARAAKEKADKEEREKAEAEQIRIERERRVQEELDRFEREKKAQQEAEKAVKEKHDQQLKERAAAIKRIQDAAAALKKAEEEAAALLGGEADPLAALDLGPAPAASVDDPPTLPAAVPSDLASADDAPKGADGGEGVAEKLQS